MSAGVPYATTPRPDTGFDNAGLGMWLFLASEVMLFGSLVSSWVLLRMAATPPWPPGRTLLSLPTGALNTVILLAASVAIALAARRLRAGRLGAGRALVAANAVAGLVFLAIKGSEWAAKLGHGQHPATSTFLAIYFTLTGVHALHVVGGVVANGWLAGPGAALAAREPARYARRVEVAGMYWQFVDAVWLVLFVLLYLL